MVKDTDKVRIFKSQIKDLEKLLYAYRNGLIKREGWKDRDPYDFLAKIR